MSRVRSCSSVSSECALGFFGLVLVRPGTAWGSLGSSGSSGSRALGGAEFDRFCRVHLGVPRGLLGSSSGSFVFVRLVRPGAPGWSLGSFVFVGFRVRTRCRWIRSGSSGSSGCALGVSGIFGVPLFRSGEPWMSLGSFSFV